MSNSPISKQLFGSTPSRVLGHPSAFATANQKMQLCKVMQPLLHIAIGLLTSPWPRKQSYVVSKGQNHVPGQLRDRVLYGKSPQSHGDSMSVHEYPSLSIKHASSLITVAASCRTEVNVTE